MALFTDPLTIPPAGSLNATGKSAFERQLPAAAARSVVNLVYGEDRIAGRVLNILAKAGEPGKTLVQVLWGYAVDSINDLQWSDADLPATVTVTHYAGAQTVADATLVAAFAAQGISGVLPLTGRAWSLIEMPTVLFNGQLGFTARIRGRRCYDPAFDSTAGGTGPQRLANPATWTYTECPAVCLADFLYNAEYGCGQSVNWGSVIATGGANRAIVPGSSEQRRLVGVSFTSASATADVAETLRAYASCFLLPRVDGIKLLPDANDAPAAIYRHSEGQIAAIDALEERDLSQAPTAVEVIYTDTSATPWRDASVTAALDGAGATRPWRLSQVRLPGIHRASQALREARERLNKLNLNNLGTAIDVFDDGIRHEEGDIVQVEHPIGLAMTAMRVTAPPMMVRPGQWRLQLVRHSAAAYSDAVASVGPSVDPGRTLPPAPPLNVAGLVGTVTRGIIRWRWTPASEREYVETRVRIGGADWDSAAPLWTGRGSEVLQTVTTTGVYKIWARHALRDGQESLAAVSYSLTVYASDLDDTVPDLTPPPTPGGVVVTAGFASLLIEHNVADYAEGHGHARTRVYGAVVVPGPAPAFGDAQLLGEFSGEVGRIASPLGTSWRIWLTWVSKDGGESAVPAGGGVGYAVATGLIGGANLAPLAVTAAALAEGAVDLGSTKVTGTITDPERFGALAVGYTVTQYLLATEGVLGNLVVDNAQIGSMSASKILAGALAVGQYIRSSGYLPGVSGWNIDADGSARFRNLIVDGNSYFDGQVTMRRPDGSVMFSAGGTLGWADITPAAGWLNSQLVPSINAAKGTNLFNGSLAAPWALDGASITNPSRPDPLGTNNAVEVTTQSGTNGYLYYHLTGLQPGYYTVKLMALVTSAHQFVVSTTNGLSWAGGNYTTATTPSASPAWVQVVLRQKVESAGLLDVALGAFHGPGGPIYSSPNPTTVAVSDLWVEREVFAGDLDATVGATIGTNLAGDFTQSSWDIVMAGRTLIRAAHIQQLTAENLTIAAVSGTINGGATSGARSEFALNRWRIYAPSGAVRVQVSA